jgi:flagellar hook-associated protein 2
MSSLSTSLYGATTNKGVGGLLSGLDTDDLVKQMTAATRNKINRQYQSKQKLLYRQEAYREVSKKLLAFSDKYFSYSSGSKTNILSSKFFESNTFKSSSNYVNVTGNAENIKNFSIDSITSVATAASFTSSKQFASTTITSDNITDYVSSLAGETMTLEYEGKSYNIVFDADFGKGLKDASMQERAVTLDDVVQELNEQIAKLKDSDGNALDLEYKFPVDSDNIVFNKGTAKLTAASSDVLNILNMKVGQNASSQSPITDIGKLTLNDENIYSDASSYFTFEYNGVQKTINLKSGLTTPSEVAIHVQKELNYAYGVGKVTFSYKEDEDVFKLSANNSTDIFGISSISKDLSNLTGLESGDYNRLNKTKSLKELGFTNDIYQIEINGEKLKFENSMPVTDVINTINSNAKAGVKVYYSSTSNTFTVKATETGTHKGVSIVDIEGGNLANSMFGSSIHSKLASGQYLKEDIENETETHINYTLFDENDNKIGTASYNKNTKNYYINYTDPATTDIPGTADYMVSAGTDTKMTYTLNGVQQEIIRSTANFTIDEINIELNEKASTITNGVNFDVTNNSDEVVERVKQFVNDYNEIINLIGTKTSEKPRRDYLPLSPEQQEDMEEEEIKNWNEEAKKGSLYGDSKMNTVLRRMRETMGGLTDVSTLTLSAIGISSASMDTSGKLVFDETKFKQKLVENPDEIANLFSNTSSNTEKDAKSGISLQLQQILRDNVGTYGTTGLLIEEAGMSNSMTSDRNYISEKMKEYDTKMADLKQDLEVERKRYWDQFSALEQSMNKLNAQSSWLTDMMG